MRPLLLVLALFAAVAGSPASARADAHTPGFQIQADGLLFGPMGDVVSQRSVRMTDLFNQGGGFGITATIGVRQHWLLGLTGGTSASTKEGTYSFTDLPVEPGRTATLGGGPYTIRRKLMLLPVLAVVQYRHNLMGPLEWDADGGFGIVSTTENMQLRSRTGNGTLVNISGYQRDPAWALGTSLAWRVPGNFDVVGSARYLGTLAGNGAIWVKNDDPGFANWALGLRYPHDTH